MGKSRRAGRIEPREKGGMHIPWIIVSATSPNHLTNLTLTLSVVHTGRELQDLFFNLHGGHLGGLRRGIRPECLGGWKC